MSKKPVASEHEHTRTARDLIVQIRRYGLGWRRISQEVGVDKSYLIRIEHGLKSGESYIPRLEALLFDLSTKQQEQVHKPVVQPIPTKQHTSTRKPKRQLQNSLSSQALVPRNVPATGAIIPDFEHTTSAMPHCMRCGSTIVSKSDFYAILGSKPVPGEMFYISNGKYKHILSNVTPSQVYCRNCAMYLDQVSSRRVPMSSSRVRIVDNSTGAIARGRRKLDLSSLPPQELQKVKRSLAITRSMQSLTDIVSDINATQHEYIDAEFTEE